MSTGYQIYNQDSYNRSYKLLQSGYNVVLGFDISAAEIAEVGVTLQLNWWDTTDKTKKDDEKWMSGSIGATVGATLGQGVNFSFKSTEVRKWSKKEHVKSLAKSYLISKTPKPTSDRGIWDKSIAWFIFFDIGVGDYLPKLGDAILNLVKRE